MKILIVEDEIEIRQSIVSMLRHSGFKDIRTAEDGQTALALTEQERIDIIISDIRMPRMSGIELLEQIRKQDKNILFVLLSGYDLFEYAQHAIKLGAFSYLLKPVQAIDLQSVLADALQEITKKRTLQDHEIRIQIQLNQGTLALRKHFILEIVKGMVTDEVYVSKRLKQYDIHFGTSDAGAFCVLIAELDVFSGNGGWKTQDKELLVYGLENIAMEILTEAGFAVYLFTAEEDKAGFLLHFDPTDPSACHKELVGICETIQHAVRAYTKGTVTIGIGSLEHDLYSVPHSYAAAKRAYAQRMVRQRGGIYACTSAPKGNKKPLSPDLKAAHVLQDCFDAFNRDAALQFIVDSYAPFYEPFAFEMDDLRGFNYQLLLMLQNILRQLSIDPETVFEDEFFLYTQVNELESLDATVSWFQALIERCFDSISRLSLRSTKKLMDLAKAYMTNHYHSDISLDQVATHLHISSEYLSREFKKETGINFLDYLIQLRISKAKQYLLEGTRKTNEIARLVGFNDEKYFSKVFKRHTGFTPSEYKFRTIHNIRTEE
ncbi:response regulator [Cohnella silvisoli]|uniref:Response regulator n=1 Tax=Cohnella silvisoli TaxID=2873699 RepID=A0ABV1KT85_9BACL|nr:response regulator [Cohnella silvisoli]MCD9021510.1 response regulator [Cohnella silvisoli]